jgi:hypothetical protein
VFTDPSVRAGSIPPLTMRAFSESPKARVYYVEGYLGHPAF